VKIGTAGALASKKRVFVDFLGRFLSEMAFLNDGLNGFTDFLRGNAGISNAEFAKMLRREVFLILMAVLAGFFLHPLSVF
jgi:hypothetical protein